MPFSARFRDLYFSRENGLAESRHVFVAGSGLPDRFRDGFHVAELGFGTGLNMLAALDSWIANGVSGTFSYTAFEAFPLTAPDLAKALDAFPEMRPLSLPLVEAWTGGERKFTVGPIRAEVIEGDARETVRAWSGLADAWFLDGFSPAKNPELWEPELLRSVALRTSPDGTVATYSAARQVRNSLAESGFEVWRQPGFGRKRHMTAGILRSRS